VFYTNEDDSIVQKRVLSGEKPFVDDRFRTSSSLVERRLVEIMELCWERQPSDRIDIFAVVRLLQETVEETEIMGS
jgi:hypothetical protein